MAESLPQEKDYHSSKFESVIRRPATIIIWVFVGLRGHIDSKTRQSLSIFLFVLVLETLAGRQHSTDVPAPDNAVPLTCGGSSDADSESKKHIQRSGGLYRAADG